MMKNSKKRAAGRDYMNPKVLEAPRAWVVRVSADGSRKKAVRQGWWPGPAMAILYTNALHVRMPMQLQYRVVPLKSCANMEINQPDRPVVWLRGPRITVVWGNGSEFVLEIYLHRKQEVTQQWLDRMQALAASEMPQELLMQWENETKERESSEDLKQERPTHAEPEPQLRVSKAAMEPVPEPWNWEWNWRRDFPNRAEILSALLDRYDRTEKGNAGLWIDPVGRGMGKKIS